MISNLSILTFTLAFALATTSSAQSCTSPCQRADSLSSSCTFPTFPGDNGGRGGNWNSVYEGLSSEQRSCLCDGNSKFLETKAECAKCHVISDRGQEKERWGREIGQVKWVAGRVCQGSVSEAVGRALGDAGQEYGGQDGNGNNNGGNDDNGNDDDNGDDEVTKTATPVAGGTAATTGGSGSGSAGQVTVTATPSAQGVEKDTATASGVTAVSTEAAGNGAAGAQELKMRGVVMGAVGVVAALMI